MKRLLTFSSNYPWLILTTILVITALLIPTLSDLRIQISAESLTVEDDPAWIAQQKNLKQFGDSDITVLLFQDGHLFTSNKLIVVKDIIDQLIKLPEVQKVTSLFNVANIKMVDEYISTKPFIETIPDNDEDLQKILSQARLNPMVIKNLVNEDGTALALNLVLENTDNNPEFDKIISEKIEKILTSYQKNFADISQIGTSYIRNTITKKIAEDQRSIMPWSVVFLVLTLAISMRSLNGALIPLFTASISITWTLAGMAMLDIPIGVMTSIIPALLIIIGSTEDIHIIAEYKGNRSKGMDVPVAIDEMSRSIGVAILLTFITTYFGFISIYTNEINLLQEFGLVASSGLFINFIITSLTVPAILKITSRSTGKKVKVANLESSIYPKLALWIFDFVLNNRRVTIIILILVGFWSVYGALSLKINNNPLGYFKDDTQIVSSSRNLHENLAGVETFSILLETGIEGTFKKIKYLEELEKIQRYIEQTDYFDKSISFADYMKTIHLAMDGGEIETMDEMYLPDDEFQVAEYLNFIKHDLFKTFITADYSATRILVRHAINDSSDLKQAVKELETFIAENIDPALRSSITGSSIVSANGADYMAAGQGKSLVLMSFVIISVIAILFVTWQAGMLALIPNLFPIVVLFGVMGHFGISLDTGTAMVAVIALGICVDDTVHFMTRYHHRSRNRDDPEEALRDTVVDESVPIFTTSFALMLGFLTFAFSSFVPITNFGLLSAMVMGLALITTFVITPLLLSYIRLVTMWDMLSLNLQAQVIEDCPLFNGMNIWSIKQTILASEVKFYKPGDEIIKQETIGDEMYVILEGDVDVRMKQEDGSVATVNHMAEGGAFGEIALVSKVPRTASVIANSNCRLLSLKWDNMERLSRFHSRIAIKLFQNLSSIVGQKLTQVNNLTILHDEASGCLNRTMIETILEQEINKTVRYHEPLSLICFTLLFKIEQQKLYDDLLRQLSMRVHQGMRNIDNFGRWDDQRFIIILPRTSEEHRNMVIERIKGHATDILSKHGHENDFKITPWTFRGDTPAEEITNKTKEILNDNPTIS